MILYKNEYTTLEDFIAQYAGERLGENAILAYLSYRSTDKENDYVIIEVSTYYAITKLQDSMINYIKVDRYVIPFDEKTVYPLQKVKKIIDWDY